MISLSFSFIISFAEEICILNLSKLCFDCKFIRDCLVKYLYKMPFYASVYNRLKGNIQFLVPSKATDKLVSIIY